MPILDVIPVNVFIVGTSILAGVILFLILWKIPDEDEEALEENVSEPKKEAEVKKTKGRKK